MKILEYDRLSSKLYAKRWANDRNPAYFNFDRLGGDCTNFVSQCVFSGAKIMNFDKNNGWYYSSINNRAPAWTGVKFFHDFLTKNKGFGPFGAETNAYNANIGDVIFLINNKNEYYHTLFLSDKKGEKLFCSAHTFDAYNRPLESYLYYRAEFVHILGVNG